MTQPTKTTAVPVRIVDGFSKGPDGLAVEPFARFANRIMGRSPGRQVRADVAEMRRVIGQSLGEQFLADLAELRSVEADLERMNIPTVVLGDD